MSTAIFIRTYARDFPWLRYCLRSIARYASGFSGLHIAVASCDWEQFQREFGEMFTGQCSIPFPVESRACTCYIDDYIGQQITKMQAWQYTDAERILYVDSDTIFTRQVTPADFMENGKPVLVVTPFDALEGDALKWVSVIEKALHCKPIYETMRRLPIIHDRMTVERCYEYIGGAEYISGQPFREFSEFNVIGSYVLQFVPQYYVIKDTTKDQISETPARQYWSRQPWTEELRTELEAIVNG